MTVELTEPQKKWIAALRSGEFKQAVGCLRRGEGYCCLGVACKVLGEDAGVTEGQFDDGSYFYGNETERRAGDLPDALAKLLGLYCGHGTRPDLQPALTQQNDCYHKTFNEIADLLETGAYFKPPEVPA